MNLINSLNTLVESSTKSAFKAGSTVRLKKHAGSQTETAKIKTLLTGVDGGVFLETPLDGSRYWNIDDLELMIRDGVFEAKAAPHSIFALHVPAFVFNGRNYEYSVAVVKVLATSAAEATDVLNTHKDDVLKHLGSRKSMPSGKPLVDPKQPIKKAVVFKDSYYHKKLPIKSSSNVLTAHGGFKNVRIAANGDLA